MKSLPRSPRLRNLGKVSAGWLAGLGITKREQVEIIGWSRFICVKSLGYNVNLNLLWALQGAVFDIPWNEIPQDKKRSYEPRSRLPREKGLATTPTWRNIHE